MPVNSLGCLEAKGGLGGQNAAVHHFVGNHSCALTYRAMPTSSVSYDPALNQPQHGSDAWFPRRALCKAGLVAATAALVLLTANGQGGHPPQASTAHVFISPAAARPNAPMVRLARPRHTTQPLRSTRHDAVSRREGLSLAGSVAAWLSGGGQRAEAFGGFGRGLDIPGYQGQSVLIPNAIKNSKVTKALEGFEFPPEYPFLPEDFVRFDESDDGNFYSAPRFVTHIDDEAIASLRTFYKAVFDQAPQGQYNVLDICSSWVSHYPGRPVADSPFGCSRAHCCTHR